MSWRLPDDFFHDRTNAEISFESARRRAVGLPGSSPELFPVARGADQPWPVEPRRPDRWERHPVAANLLDVGVVVSLVLAAWLVAIGFGVGLLDLVRAVF